MGFDDVKDIVLFGAKLGNGLGQSLKDGKITLADAANFIPALTALPAALTGIGEAKKKLIDEGLTDAEKEELISFFSNEFDIPQDETEKFIEEALNIVVTIYGFAKTWF